MLQWPYPEWLWCEAYGLISTERSCQDVRGVRESSGDAQGGEASTAEQ